MKRIVTLAALLLACVCPFHETVAQSRDEYIFSRIDHLQGLSNSAVICIFKDKTELMWFGTYDGVNCFDSKDMEIFRTDFSKSPTLDNNVIYGINQADGNNLWFYTRLGVNRFSKDKKEVIANYSVPSGSSLCSNSRGDTWLVSTDSIAYYNTLHGRFISIEEPGISVGNPQTGSFVAHDGTLWLFTDRDGRGDVHMVSLNAFDTPKSGTKPGISRLQFHHRPVENIFYHNDIAFCFVDADKDLYMYDIVQRSKLRLRNIKSLMDKYGDITGVIPFYDDIIIAFRTNGLIRLNVGKQYEEEVIDRNLRVFCLYKDSEQGILWVGVDGRGAMMYARRNSIATNLMTQSLSPNFTRQVRSIMTDAHGGLWFGTKGDGLVNIRNYAEGMEADKTVVYFPEKKQPARTYVRDETEFPVFSLRPGKYMNGFWVGSGSAGVFRYDFDDMRLHHLADRSGMGQPDEVHEIFEADENTLYVATAAGTGFRKLTLDRQGGEITIKEQKLYRFFYDRQEISTFFAMLPEGDSILWLGSRERGLVRFNIATERYRVISLRERLEGVVDDVLSICRTSNGDIFAGTTTGLVRLTFNGDSIDIGYTGREHGFLNDMIHGILEDANGLLWLSTNKGVIKYDPADGSSHTYYYSGGVQIGEFSDDAYYKCPYTGRLFFGGVDGLLHISEAVSNNSDHYPEIVLRKISLGHRKVNISDHYTADGNGLKFKYTDAFSVSFVAPDFISGSDIEYSWMLERHDRAWSPFGISREASLTKVPPGKYIFRVRYRKDIFDTDIKNFSIPLRIIPLWHQTITARFLLAMFIVAAVAFFILMFRRHFENKRLIVKLLKSENTSQDMMAAALDHELMGMITCTTREQVDFIGRIAAIIKENIGVESLGSTLIADRMAMSVRQFYRKFKEISGIPPTELIKELRMQKAATLLREGKLSIHDVIEEVGISSRSYFYKEFNGKFGMTPKDYRATNGGNITRADVAE